MVPGSQWKEREHRKEVPCPCLPGSFFPPPQRSRSHEQGYHRNISPEVHLSSAEKLLARKELGVSLPVITNNIAKGKRPIFFPGRSSFCHTLLGIHHCQHQRKKNHTSVIFFQSRQMLYLITFLYALANKFRPRFQVHQKSPTRKY